MVNVCGRRRWTKEEDVVLVKCIWRVCVTVGVGPEEVVRRVEVLLGPRASLRHRDERFSPAADRLICKTFVPELERIDRSPVGAARRARALLSAARERAAPSSRTATCCLATSWLSSTPGATERNSAFTATLGAEGR